MAVTAERDKATSNGSGHPADVGPPTPPPSMPNAAPSKLRLRLIQMMDRAQPAMEWVNDVVEGPLVRGLRTEFGRILLVMSVLMIVSANLIWLLERSGADNAPFSSNYLVGIGDAIWYVIVTMANVVLVSLFTATASSLLVARRIKEGDSLDADTLTGHTVVCGWNRNLPRFLTALSRAGERVVVLINEAPNDVIEPHLKAYSNLRILFVRGSFTQESILAGSAIKQAAYAVIVPDESGTGSEAETDEQKTVLASLIIKEINPRIKVFVHVLHREDAAHVKRAKADEVIVSDEFTGELLANHVAHPGAPQALAELMSFDTSHTIKAVDIPQSFVGGTVGAYIQYLRDNGNMLLMGFAVREEGFGLSQAMRGGSDYITEFIQQQVQAAGISMSTDERVVVRLNPALDYVIGPKHSALVMS